MRLNRPLIYSIVGALALLGVAACGNDDSGLPATNGSSVRDYLEDVNYRDSWELWPGKGELYEGAEPHGMLLTTYVNDSAMGALDDQDGAMPDGAIIVKENYMPDGTLGATTVMYKVDGYNAEHADWFWTKYAADGAIQAEGKVEGCQACHDRVTDNDYIFTSQLR